MGIDTHKPEQLRIIPRQASGKICAEGACKTTASETRVPIHASPAVVIPSPRQITFRFRGYPPVKIVRHSRKKTRRVGQIDRVAARVAVSVMALRIRGVATDGIAGHEAAHARRIVSSSKVIKAGFEVAFFAGEFVRYRIVAVGFGHSSPS